MRRRRARGRARRSTWSTTRWCCCAASRHDGAARDLPAAARRRTSGSPQARALVPYLRDLGVSHLYLPPSFQAREGSTHGYDVVDPTSISNELGGEAEFCRAGRARCARRGHGDRARHRPEPHGDRRREPLLARPRAARAVLRPRRDDRPPPALLRHRPPGRRCARRTRRCSRRPTRSRCALVREGIVDGLRIDHPDGLADPAGYLQRLRDGGVEHVWVEKILDPGEPLRDWPVDGTVGYEFLNDVCGAVRRPRGRGAADRPVGRDLRRRPAASPTGRSRPSSSRRGRRSRPRSSGCCARRPSASPAWSARWPRCPVYRTYVEPWSGRGAEDADREAIAEAGLPDVAGARAALESAGLGRVRHPLPADDAAGHGQGRRGHRVLPLRAAARAQRRRRRPGPLRRSRRATSTRPTPSARSASRATCSSPRRTTPSARATCGRGSARWPAMPDEFAAHVRTLAERLALADAPAARRRRSSSYFIFQTLLGAWPISERAPGGLPREGDARGQAAHDLGRARRGARGRGPGVRARRCSTHRDVPARLRAVPARARARRATAPRSASCCSS